MQKGGSTCQILQVVLNGNSVFPVEQTLLMAQEPINRGLQQLHILASCNSVFTDQFIYTETILGRI